MSDESQTIVVDNGSGFLKAGYGGDEEPCSIFPNVIGYLKHSGVYTGFDIHETSKCGHDAIYKYHNLLSIKHPIEHGIITNFDNMVYDNASNKLYVSHI